MKHLKIVLPILLTCLFWACSFDVETLRLKRRQEMDKALENYWKRKIDEEMSMLDDKSVIQRSPELLQKGIEIHEKAKKMLASIHKDKTVNIEPYILWFQDEFIKCCGEASYPSARITDKYLHILGLELALLSKIYGIENGLQTRAYNLFLSFSFMDFTQHQAFENETLTALACLSMPKYDYRLDSLWINNVLQTKYNVKNNIEGIKIPLLKVGKHTIYFKFKLSHQSIAEKDTTIFATHTFDVLPKNTAQK